MIIKTIGKGAFGMVYAGTFKDNHVAIKSVDEVEDYNVTTVLRRVGDPEEPETESKGLREAAILIELRHPNIVRFHGVVIRTRDTTGMSAMQRAHTSPIEGYLYVTELCDMALSSCIMGVGLTEGQELWEMLVQIATGMKYLHKMGIVHRDLKPG